MLDSRVRKGWDTLWTTDGRDVAIQSGLGIRVQVGKSIRCLRKAGACWEVLITTTVGLSLSCCCG